MMEKVDTDPEWKSLVISRGTVISQAMVFFIAAFRTTSTALTFLSYALATNPEIQDKLLDELDVYLSRHDGKISHETINELVYMNACMLETLRLYPPVSRLERVCNKTWKHEPSRLEIPNRIVIQVPVWSVQNTEEYYEDATSFKPEIFLAENKDKLNQYAYLTFGAGPHNCVGMRFAKEEVIFAMANLLKCFRLKANENTRLKWFAGNTFTIAMDTFSIDVVKRD